MTTKVWVWKWYRDRPKNTLSPHKICSGYLEFKGEVVGEHYNDTFEKVRKMLGRSNRGTIYTAHWFERGYGMVQEFRKGIPHEKYPQGKDSIDIGIVEHIGFRLGASKREVE